MNKMKLIGTQQHDETDSENLSAGKLSSTEK